MSRFTPVLVWLAVAGPALATEVAIGDSAADVRATLGAPRGQAFQDGRKVLYYERGEVELQGEVVTRVALRTPEEFALQQAREEKARAEREVRRAQLVAEGTAIRDRKLADPNFRDAPLAYQVSFWEDMARRYPDVSVVEPLTIARMRWNEIEGKRREAEEAAARAREREEARYAADDTQVYPLFTPSPYYRRYRGPYYSPGLGPIEYTFFPSPLPPYTTPSGLPGGSMTGPVVNLPSFDSGFPQSFDRGRGNSQHWGGRGGRGHSHHRGYERDGF